MHTDILAYEKKSDSLERGNHKFSLRCCCTLSANPKFILTLR